jgi:hypothetical protein
VNSMNLSHNHLHRTDWQVSGELQLAVGSNPDGAIRQWLMKILEPFQLPEQYVSKILKSIEDAASRVLSTDTVEAQFEHLNIVILTPAGQPSDRQTWGFFRLERMESKDNSADSKSHHIEYYLYPERTP